MNNDGEYNTFLSWSGSHSKEIGSLLRDWLPNVVPSVRPWLSSEDIGKGSVWPTELNRSLATCAIGVVVLTPENLNSSWLIFEAGVLFKAREQRPVFTLCCGVEPPLVGPLGQFQTTQCDSADMLRLVQDINKAIGLPHDRLRIEAWFSKFWPECSQRLTEIGKTYSGTLGPARATDRALLEEILGGVRPIRQLQVAIEEAARSRVASIEWYAPFWFAHERECNWLLISRTSIAKFIKEQMRDPARIDRVIQSLWDESEAISGFQETRQETAYEGLLVTWHSRYDRGLDGHFVYVETITNE